MYGLAVDTDLSATQGCTVEQVALGQHQVQLHLSDRVAINIESDFSVTLPDGSRSLYERPADAAQALAERLGCDVVDAAVTEPGVVTLRFIDGSSLAVYDSTEHYESYQIRIGDRLIVV